MNDKTSKNPNLLAEGVGSTDKIKRPTLMKKGLGEVGKVKPKPTPAPPKKSNSD